MKNNDNDLVSLYFEYVSNNANSILGNKIAYVREKYFIYLFIYIIHIAIYGIHVTKQVTLKI